MSDPVVRSEASDLLIFMAADVLSDGMLGRTCILPERRIRHYVCGAEIIKDSRLLDRTAGGIDKQAGNDASALLYKRQTACEGVTQCNDRVHC